MFHQNKLFSVSVKENLASVVSVDRVCTLRTDVSADSSDVPDIPAQMLSELSLKLQSMTNKNRNRQNSSTSFCILRSLINFSLSHAFNAIMNFLRKFTNFRDLCV